MTRTQWTLAAVLLVQLLLLLLIAAPWSSGDGSAGPRALLPELDANDPARIEIREGDDLLVLSHATDGWHVEQAAGYPADPVKVDKLLDDLRQLEVRRPVVKGSRYHDALKVSEEQNERRLRVQPAQSSDGDVVLFLGSSPNYGVNHVRRGGEDEVYEVRGLSPWDIRTEATTWIDTQLVDVRAEDVTSLRLSNRHGEFALTRQDGAWVLEDGADAATGLDPTKVDSFLRSIGSLRFSEPAGRIDGGQDFGFGTAVASLDLIYDVDGQLSEALELVVGDEVEAESGARYAHRAGSMFGVVLGKADSDRLLDEKVADLILQSEGAGANGGD